MHNKSVLGSVALIAAVLIGGCFGHAGASAEVDAPVVFAAEPTLVVVEPGIWVVRDYDYPVYYVDDYYWVYRDDVWHRSRTYDGGWARVEASTVPTQIVSRDHRAYIHYHGAPNAPTRSAPRDRESERAQPERAAPERPRAPPPEHARDEEHANDRHDAPPRRDERPSADPHAERPGNRDHDKREDHEKADDRRRDEKREQQDDDQKRGGKRDDHDKR